MAAASVTWPLPTLRSEPSPDSGTVSVLVPDVPTASEQGVRGVEVNAWYGVFAPQGTPEAVRSQVNSDINEMLKLADIREKLATAGLDVLGGSSQVLGDFMRADRQRYSQLAKELNIKAD